jgi:hypothetical protein
MVKFFCQIGEHFGRREIGRDLLKVQEEKKKISLSRKMNIVYFF